MSANADSNMAQDMDERTLTALQGSIAKWQAIVDGTGEDGGWKNCPLCAEFSNPETPADQECNGCPVYEETGEPWCSASPYRAWERYVGMHHKVFDDRSRELAQAELDFLKSLLPLAATTRSGEE